MNQLYTLRMRTSTGLAIASLGGRFLQGLAAMLIAAMLAACGGGGGDGSGGTGESSPGVSEALVAFTVIDTLGQPIAGATLRSARATALTNAQGRADVSVSAGSEQVVAVEKAGFAEQVKVITLPAGSTASRLQAMLIAREAPLTITANEAGGSVGGKDGVKLSLPPGALVTSSGVAVTGPVEFTLTPVDVTQLDIGAFPGLFEGMPTGAARSLIISYGTAELVPRQNGQKLQLAAGKSAEIELPMYVATHQNGSTAKAGDKVALWSLNAATGLWTQEGEGTVVRSTGSPTGLALRATITHFSWWNVDAASGRASVNLTVNVPGETLPPGTVANVEGRIVAGAGPTWAATTTATPGVAVALAVPAGSNTQLSARIELADKVCTGTVNVSPSTGSAVNSTINATCAALSVPRIARPGALSATNSLRDLSVQVLIDGPRADLVEVFANREGTATRIVQFNAAIQVQPFFTAFWNSLPFAEGTYTLVARATRAGISRDSAPVQVVVDRTPPTLASVTPAPGSDVTQATTFTLDFSEPVNPLPFALTDAVKLAITPLGASVPVEMLILAELNPSGTRLTVQPQAALQVGAVSLTWGGLQDAAGNAVTGTVTASFVVEPIVATLLTAGGELMHAPQALACPPSLRLSADGTPYVAHVVVTDGVADARVSRRVGGVWQSLGFANDLATTHLPNFTCPTLGVTAAGEPFVAMSTAAGRSGDTDRRQIVRRFNGSAWETVRDIASNTNGTAAISIVMDGANRPVIVWSRDNPATFARVLTAERFEGGVWQTLAADFGSLGSLGAIGDFRLAVRPDNDVAVAIFSQTGPFSSAIHAVVIGNSGITSLGIIDGVGDTTRAVGVLDIAVDATETVVSYVLATSSTSQTRTVRFDTASNAWRLLGTDADQVVSQRQAALAFQGGTLVQVLPMNNQTSLARRWNGSAWSAFTTLKGVVSVEARLVVQQDSLFIGFTQPGGSAGVARLDVP